MLWLPLSAVSPLALAVGLGQATVNSPLQAPLDATVPLVDAADVALEDVQVEIADQSAFNALGLEWKPLAANVRAELQRSASGARLVLRSEQAVNEPWLDLLVTITTPEGRRTEALTLLFDPPDYVASPAAPATLATPATITTTTTAAPVASPASAVAPSSSAPRDIAYVASGDTLWGVAARIKPADVTVQQMMVALVDANPAAFPTGNVDDMRAGQTLSVPNREQLMARSPAQAAQSIQSMRQTSRATPAVQPSTDSTEPAQPPESAPADPSPVESAPAATVEEGELAGLTLNDLAEQLLESQAMLQAVLDEREAMRAEMAALRQEVASLTQALNASQQETQRALAAAESRVAEARSASNTPTAVNAPVSASSGPGVIERLEQYQWPLASAALALLLGALVWSRKRRERQWEDAPAPAGFAADVPPPKRSEPSVAAAPETESVSQVASPEEALYTPPYEESVEEPSQTGTSLYDTEEPVAKESVAKEPADEQPAFEEREAPKSDLAFSLMEDETPSSAAHNEKHQDASPDDLDDEWFYEDEKLVDHAPPGTDDDEAALNAAFLETPEPVDEGAHAALADSDDETALPEPKPVQEEDRAHYIDYHPPR
ncbi:FimV/HubP family polar landmark protein [Halomonas sp. LY9]